MVEVVIFAKPPLPGRVKTRLVPPLTFPEAARFAEAFLADLLRTVASLPGCRVHVALPPGADRETLQELLAKDVALADQGSGDLGRRLTRVIEGLHSATGHAVAVVGSDHPDLPRGLLVEMLDEARAGGLGWIPTEDGGFAAIALPRPLPGLFDEVPWSSAGVADAVRRNAAERKVRLSEVGRWYDVDTVADLHRLARELESSDRCPATQSVLRELRPPLGERADGRDGKE